MPVITVAASAPSGSASAASQSARKIERTVWIMLSPSLWRDAEWRDADRTTGKPRHEERDDVSGGLSVRPETRKLRPVPPEEALERLDLAVPSGWKKQRGGSDGAGVVAAPAPAGVEAFATRDALGERAKPALEDGLARGKLCGPAGGRPRRCPSGRGKHDNHQRDEADHLARASHAPGTAIAARRALDERQGADREEARRVEREQRSGRIALMDADEPRAPAAIESEGELDDASPGPPVRISLTAPAPVCLTDAELRCAHELEISSPQRVEDRQARAPRNPDADDHDGRQPPQVSKPAGIEDPLGVDQQKSGPEDAQREGDAHTDQDVSFQWTFPCPH